MPPDAWASLLLIAVGSIAVTWGLAEPYPHRRPGTAAPLIAEAAARPILAPPPSGVVSPSGWPAFETFSLPDRQPPCSPGGQPSGNLAA